VRRLPGILLLTVATLIVIVALLVSGCVSCCRSLTLASAAAGEDLHPHRHAGGCLADHRQLANFGPTLDVRDIHAGLKDGGKWRSNA
jgi:uncharacterized protein YhdP